MFILTHINKLIRWLDVVDPYYISRITLRKALYAATWMSMVNLIAKPDIFLAFSLSAIVSFGYYESPFFNTFSKKNKALTSAVALFTISSLLFYFLFPCKFYLMIAALSFYAALYWLTYHRFPEFKSSIIGIVAFSAFMSTILPLASLQIGIDIFYCCMLSLVTIFIALNTHPNLYQHVWHRATKQYVETIEVSIENSINHEHNHNYMQQISHTDTIRNFKHLFPRRKLLNRMRINFHMSNINFAVRHVYYLQKNVEFWLAFKQHVYQFRMALEKHQPCSSFSLIATSEKNEIFVQKHLLCAINNWNTLCSQR